MSAAHTPGPWWVTSHGIRNQAGHICEIKRPHRYGDQDRYAKELAERKADEFLMAAAPDLLAALEGLLAVASVRIDDTRIGQFDAARAAIAKATGSAA